MEFEKKKKIPHNTIHKIMLEYVLLVSKRVNRSVESHGFVMNGNTLYKRDKNGMADHAFEVF